MNNGVVNPEEGFGLHTKHSVHDGVLDKINTYKDNCRRYVALAISR